MGRLPWRLVDGPLEGETYALEVDDGDEVALKLQDGTTAIYGAKKAREYGDDNLLYFIGIDPFASPGRPKPRN